MNDLLKKHRVGLVPSVIRESIYLLFSEYYKKILKNSIQLIFAGDLILLRDMDERGSDENALKYNFDETFAHIKSCLEVVCNFGIFEGPVAEVGCGCSNSDYYDYEKTVMRLSQFSR